MGRQKETLDETPYVVPDLFTQMNNNILRSSTKLGPSLTQDDLRLHDSGVSSQVRVSQWQLFMIILKFWSKFIEKCQNMHFFDKKYFIW